MAGNDILFTLKLNDGPFKAAAKAAESAHSPLHAALGALAGAVAAAFAFDKIIEAANDADKAVNGAAIAMKLAGEYSAGAFNDLKDFAGHLQDITGVGDDTTLKMVGLATQFGLTTDQAKKVVTVAIDMSKAMGTDLQTAVENLSATYNGHVGRLGKVNDAVGHLNEGMLKAGQAVDLLGAQFKGVGEASLHTFGGELDAVKTRFGDLLESVGNLIVQNPAFIKALELVEKGIRSLTAVVDNNSGKIKAFLNGALIGFVEAVAGAIGGLSGVIEISKILVDTVLTIGRGLALLVQALSGLQVVQDIIDHITRGLVEIVRALEALAAKENGSLVLKIFGTSSEELSLKLKEVADGLDAIDKKEGGGQAVESYLGKIVKNLDSLTKAADGMFDGAGEGARNLQKYLQDTVIPTLRRAGTDVPEIDVQGRRPPKTQFGTFGDNVGAVTFADAVRAFGRDLLDAGKSIATSFAETILAGADGAKTFLSKIAGSAAGTAAESVAAALGYVGPEIAAIAGPIGAGAAALTQALAQGPDYIKAQVEAFTQALPGLIDNIVKAIPVLVEELAKHAPEIIQALADGAPRISAAIALALSNPDTYRLFVQGLATELINAIDGKFANLDHVTRDFQDKVEASGEQFGDAVRVAGQQLQDAGTRFATYMDTVGQNLANDATEFARQFHDIFDAGVLKPLNQWAEDFAETAGQVASEIFTIFKEAANTIYNALAEVGNALVDFLSTAFDNFADTIRQAARDFIEGVTGQKSGNAITQGKALLPKLAQISVDAATGGGYSAVKAAGFGLTDSAGSGGLTDVYLSQILVELRKPTVATAQATVDGKTLADIILQLSRSGARLA